MRIQGLFLVALVAILLFGCCGISNLNPQPEKPKTVGELKIAIAEAVNELRPDNEEGWITEETGLYLLTASESTTEPNIMVGILDFNKSQDIEDVLAVEDLPNMTEGEILEAIANPDNVWGITCEISDFKGKPTCTEVQEDIRMVALVCQKKYLVILGTETADAESKMLDKLVALC